MSRTISANVITAAESAEKRILYLLFIEVDGVSDLHYANMLDDITFDGDIYTSKSFAFPSSKHGTALDYEQVSVQVGNLDSALAGVAVNVDLRGNRVKVKQLFMNSNGTVIENEAIDVVDGVIDEISLTESIGTLTLTSPLVILERTAPAWNFGTTCRWRFGDADCTFDATSTRVIAQTVDAGSTSTVIADAARSEAVNYWADGVLEITSGTYNGVMRRVLSSAVGSITLEHGLDGAPAAGTTYTLTQGCDKTYTTCGDKFSNTANFGGFASMPRAMFRED